MASSFFSRGFELTSFCVSARLLLMSSLRGLFFSRRFVITFAKINNNSQTTKHYRAKIFRYRLNHLITVSAKLSNNSELSKPSADFLAVLSFGGYCWWCYPNLGCHISTEMRSKSSASISIDSRLSWLPLPFWLFNDMAKGSSAASRRSTSRLSCPLARRSSVSPPVCPSTSKAW